MLTGILIRHPHSRPQFRARCLPGHRTASPIPSPAIQLFLLRRALVAGVRCRRWRVVRWQLTGAAAAFPCTILPPSDCLTICLPVFPRGRERVGGSQNGDRTGRRGGQWTSLIVGLQ